MTRAQLRRFLDETERQARALIGGNAIGPPSSSALRTRDGQRLLRSSRVLRYVVASELSGQADDLVSVARIGEALLACIELIDAHPALGAGLEKSGFTQLAQAIGWPSNPRSLDERGRANADFPEEQFTAEPLGVKAERDLWERVLETAHAPQSLARRAVLGIDDDVPCPLRLYVACALRANGNHVQRVRAYWCLQALETGAAAESEVALARAIELFEGADQVIEYYVFRHRLRELWAGLRRSYAYVAVTWRPGAPASLSLKHCLSDKAENDREIADFRGHYIGENEVEARAGQISAVMNFSIISGEPFNQDDWADLKSGRVRTSLLPRLDLPHGSRIVVRPAGDIHRVPFEALQDWEKGALGDHYSFLYVRNPVLASPPIPLDPATTGTALFVGGCDYDEELGSHDDRLRIPGRQGFFEPLPGAEQEVQSLAAYWHGEELVGPRARKQEVLAALSQAPSVVHFATHAFAVNRQHHMSSQPHSDTVTITDPKFPNCVYSALALSGANGHMDDRGRFWARADGLLRVEDVLQLDLSRTCFVFLSACHTGIGAVDFREELDSLRAAFLSAGAKCVVGSLWPVNDREASAFVRRFYEAVRSGSSVAAALLQARRKSREISAATRNAFVAVGSDQTFGGTYGNPN